MDFNAHLTIEGENCLQWIKKDEEGLIDLYFDTEEGEISLRFEPKCFATLVEMSSRFVNTGETARNGVVAKGRVRPDVSIWMEDEEVSLEAELCEVRDEDRQSIEISSRTGKINIGFNESQAWAIKECCGKIVDINEKSRAVQRKTIVDIPVRT